MLLIIIPILLFIYPAWWPFPIDVQLYDTYYVLSPTVSFLISSTTLLFIIYSIKEAFYRYNRPFQNGLLITIICLLGGLILPTVDSNPLLEQAPDTIVRYLSYFYYFLQAFGLFLAYKIGKNSKHKQ